MTFHRMLYLAGEPGIGKTTVMENLTAGWGTPANATRLPEHAPARMVWSHPDGWPERHTRPPFRAVELGRRRPGGFSGTDALPMAVIGEACAYLTEGTAAAETELLLVEGARLANRRFLTTARDAGWGVTVVVMVGEAAAAARRADRGSAQAASFVKGRRTAALGLVGIAQAEGLGHYVIEVSEATTPQEQAARVARQAHGVLYG